LFLCVPGSDRLLDPDPRDNLFSVDESIVQVQLSEPRQIPRCQSHPGAAKMDTLRIPVSGDRDASFRTRGSI
jgi:hypothetical protein